MGSMVHHLTEVNRNWHDSAGKIPMGGARPSRGASSDLKLIILEEVFDPRVVPGYVGNSKHTMYGSRMTNIRSLYDYTNLGRLGALSNILEFAHNTYSLHPS